MSVTRPCQCGEPTCRRRVSTMGGRTRFRLHPECQRLRQLARRQARRIDQKFAAAVSAQRTTRITGSHAWQG